MGLISIYPFCLKWICKNDSHIHINNKHNNIVHITAFSIHPWVAEIPKYADRAGVCPIDWRYLNMWLCQVIWSKKCLNKKKTQQEQQQSVCEAHFDFWASHWHRCKPWDYIPIWLVVDLPLWKMEFVSWKNKKMFQTTNQPLYPLVI